MFQAAPKVGQESHPQPGKVSRNSFAIVESVQGKADGYVLSRSAERSTVLDVVLAIEGPGSQFVCTELRQRGPLATLPEDCTTTCPAAKTMLEAEQA